MATLLAHALLLLTLLAHPHTAPSTQSTLADFYRAHLHPASSGHTDPSLAGLVPRCAFEDSTGCYWNAAVRGNRTGTSFVRADGHTYRIGY